jgi:hypothetical protein
MNVFLAVFNVPLQTNYSADIACDLAFQAIGNPRLFANTLPFVGTDDFLLLVGLRLSPHFAGDLNKLIAEINYRIWSTLPPCCLLLLTLSLSSLFIVPKERGKVEN